MSFIYKAVDDLIDQALERLKRDLEDYAHEMRHEVELYVDSLVRQVVKTIAIGVLAAVLVAGGFIFALIGLVTYLSEVVGPPAAWGIVGIGMVACGGILLLVLGGRSSKSMMRPSRTHDRP